MTRWQQREGEGEREETDPGAPAHAAPHPGHRSSDRLSRPRWGEAERAVAVSHRTVKPPLFYGTPAVRRVVTQQPEAGIWGMTAQSARSRGRTGVLWCG